MENQNRAIISIIVAMSRQRAIGFRNRLPWHLPEDMAHFKALTTGHTVIMGRKTFESLPNGALPHRRNVVITRQTENMRQHRHDIVLYDSLEEALKREAKEQEIFIIGGESIYRQALPFADKASIVKHCLLPTESTLPSSNRNPKRLMPGSRK